jgi:acyl-CoA dehydrogenase
MHQQKITAGSAVTSAANSTASSTANSATALANAVKEFTEQHIITNETLLAQGNAEATQKIAELTHLAQQAGLWGLFYPKEWGGKVRTLEEYLPIAEQEGRSEYGPLIFGSRATLDLHMLQNHASAEIRQRFLPALAAGQIMAAYGMSEPDSIGSIPATIQTTASFADGQWLLSGKKWFISRAKQAAFITVVARTQAHAATEDTFSMLIVPTDTAGFAIEQEQALLGRQQGQCALRLDQVAIPAACLLGQQGRGLVLMQERLGLGRTLNASHWLGLAKRCYDLMCQRICSPRGQMARLAEKQLVRQHAFRVYQAIVHARAQLQLAAQGWDQRLVGNDMQVNMAKLTASHTLSLAVDSAIQIFGAEGLSDNTPLSSIYRSARATHILDGTDEALINNVGRQLLQAYADQHHSKAAA